VGAAVPGGRCVAAAVGCRGAAGVGAGVLAWVGAGETAGAAGIWGLVSTLRGRSGGAVARGLATGGRTTAGAAGT
jgi:hypothetical protein